MSLGHNLIKQEISPENKNTTKSRNAYLCQMYLFLSQILTKMRQVD